VSFISNSNIFITLRNDEFLEIGLGIRVGRILIGVPQRSRALTTWLISSN